MQPSTLTTSPTAKGGHGSSPPRPCAGANLADRCSSSATRGTAETEGSSLSRMHTLGPVQNGHGQSPRVSRFPPGDDSAWGTEYVF